MRILFRIRLLTAALAAVMASTALSAPGLVAVAGAPDTHSLVSLQRQLPGATQIHIGLSFRSVDGAGATAFVNSLYDSTSPNFHQFISMKEYAKRFGASDEDIAAVKGYLAANGFTEIKVANSGLFISAKGSFANVESAFHTRMGSYQRPASLVEKGEPDTYYAPQTPPMLPEAIASKVAAVHNLSDILIQHPAGFHKTALAPVSHKVALRQGASGYGPLDLSTGYDTTVLHNAKYFGQQMGIAIYSPTGRDPNDTDIFAQYFTNLYHSNNVGYPITGYHIFDGFIDGGPTNSNGAGEASLDIQCVIGQSPNATVYMLEPDGSPQGELDAFDAVSAIGVIPVITSSWDYEETTIVQNNAQQFATDFDNECKALDATGVSIFVASGDNGAYDRENPPKVSTNMEASSNWVTGVGGSTLKLSTTNSAWLGETAWTYNSSDNSGGGGGLSVLFPRMTWAIGPGVINSYSNGKRQVPDVAANAGPTYPYAIVIQEAWNQVWGTSAATPLWASNVLLMDQYFKKRLGFLDPGLYIIGNEFESSALAYPNLYYVYHDITSGTNGIEPTTKFWDFATGWGSADFYKLWLDLGLVEGMTGFRPDFQPYNPHNVSGFSAWTSPVMIHASTSSVVEPTSFSHLTPYYFAVAQVNFGVTDGFRTTAALSIDGAIVSKPVFLALPKNYFGYFINVLGLSNTIYSTKLSAGTHTIKLVVNNGNSVFETNYTNNTFTRTITVQ